MRFELTDTESEDGPRLICPACGMPPRQEDTYRPDSRRMECRLVCDSCDNAVKIQCSWKPESGNWEVEQGEETE
ncbi:MAG: hypothetical protein V5B78_05675 [Desulfohalobiaceae bacterium]